mmetsp:Transcript_34449/g.53505  ORF Transcript_34449/g.53505 Transcript_34449/m.53505 type:complete len:210 (-) Transcript_34449:804-1433(-)
MAPVLSSIVTSKSLILPVRPFALSWDVPNCALQYSCFASSSTCSCLSKTIILSIILKTFVKSTLRPVKASSRNRTSAPVSFGTFFNNNNTFCVAFSLPESSCTKLALGNAFLKRSRASSSFKILIVSCMATNSSARVLTRSSISFVFVSQSASKSLRNFWFSISAASLSVSSCFMRTTDIASSPERPVFFSIDAWSVWTSFFFADMRSS